jgi:hypothetical protein
VIFYNCFVESIKVVSLACVTVGRDNEKAWPLLPS